MFSFLENNNKRKRVSVLRPEGKTREDEEKEGSAQKIRCPTFIKGGGYRLSIVCSVLGVVGLLQLSAETAVKSREVRKGPFGDMYARLLDLKTADLIPQPNGLMQRGAVSDTSTQSGEQPT